MFITRRALPRRTFLRGSGATLALPLLDSMVPPLTARADGRRAAHARVRLRAARRDHESVDARVGGPGFELPPILKPLEPFRDVSPWSAIWRGRRSRRRTMPAPARG